MRSHGAHSSPRLTPGERDSVRSWLERERARALRAADRAAEEAGELLGRRAERDPCAYLSPTTLQEDSDLVERSRRATSNMQALREIEEALGRLEEDPDRFGACGLCGERISMERLEVVPSTSMCGVCASAREA